MSHKYGLALHTTTPQLGLAISNRSDDSRQQTWDLGRDTSSHLHQYLIKFMGAQTWQDLDLIAVAKGPGGFTGSRIGVVAARTLAQQLEVPLYGISSLEAFAWSYFKDNSLQTKNLLAVQMQARREQLFVGVYGFINGRWQTHLPDTLMTASEWETRLASLNSNYQLVEIKDNLGTTVGAVLQLAHQQQQQGIVSHWSSVVPFYGQHPVTLG